MALISSGLGIGVAVGMAGDVDVAVGVRVGAGVKVWVAGAVSDESGAAEFVPVQAAMSRVIIHKIISALFFVIRIILRVFL